ncbi:thiamine pyrophosphate-binding protein [Amycolatopsis taiwanensis]|uniref:Thiamine pyrophosphate enzyme n=1 Tax=Amycolatopsis taiwanensis TaxID=342230 RepID=A0A9W6R7N1_9PSEU|nr:thiamine pyrophosphate-binding protein [Amycolatopsis taiwanensis]GLY68950.1 thiamine pyrophosphate enzyme [Amycolatopsis taiwanensis]
MAKMTGGDALTQALISEGVDTVFGIPGVQLDGLTDGMYRRREELELVVPRHEQATSYMADGYHRASGRPGVAMVVPGPGVLNAGSGMATAYACSSQVMLLAGTIPSPLVGSGLGALHEIPRQTETIEGLTKWTARPRRVEEIPDLVHEGFRQMRTGRPRPVALELGPDLLHAVADLEPGEPFAVETPEVPDGAVAELARLLAASTRPVIHAGGGMREPRAFKLLARLADLLDAPVVMSENGRGAIDARDPHALPAFALWELRATADLVVSFGSRFLTPFGQQLNIGDARLALVNIDAADLRPPRRPDLAVDADAVAVLEALVERLAPRSTWGEELHRLRADCEARIRQQAAPQMEFVDAIRAALPEDGIFVNELTQIGYVSTYGFPVQAPRSYVWPGYQGTLGYAMPTALGAAVGAGGRPVVAVTGDGGIGWSLQEFATAKKYGIPLVTVLFEDARFGNVWRIQRDTYGGRFIGSDLTNPDFGMLAQAFGLDFALAEDAGAVRKHVAAAIAARRPAIVKVPVDVFPSPWPLIHEPRH